MAQYRNFSDLTQSTNSVFGYGYEPNTAAPYGGVYKCIGCGHEIGIAQYHALPPQNHHQHGLSQGKIRWRPVVIHT